MTKKYICDKIKFILMKFLYKIKGILFFLIFFHSGFLFSQENNRTVITIDNANSTRYEKDKDIGIKKYLRGLAIRVFIVLIL